MYKELVEHCRAIHLALIALCFGLLVAGTSGMDSPEILAHNEALAVSKIVERLKLNWWTTTIGEKFSTAFSGDLSRNFRISELLLTDSGGIVHRLPIVDTWFLTKSRASTDSLSPVDIVPHDIPNYILGHQVIKTLDEFARTWTLLSSHRNLVALELTLGGVRISSDGTTELSVPPDQDNPSFITSQTRESPATLLSRDGAIDKLAATLKDISRFGHTDKTISPFEAAKQYLHSKVPGDGCILFSVSARAIVIVQCDCESRTPSLQKELISGITPSPPTGTYSNSFPNLARTTTWIDQSPIDKLEKHLYDRAFTVGEKIDIFGAKISENAVASWGLVVLGSTYAWFIVHLFKLGSFGRASVSKAEPYAWIGLFDDSLSRLAFAATALALPCGTSLVLVRLRLQALEASLYAWDIVLALSITVAFSLAAIHGIGRLWRVNWNQSFIRRR